jgi:hypothetical protein
MENTNNNTELAVQAPGAVTAIDNDALINLMNQSTNVDKLEPVMSLTANYLELAKPGESFKCLFVDFSTINVNGKSTDELTGEESEGLKEIKAVRLLANKQLFLNGGVALVNELEKLNLPSGTPILITYKEKKGNLKVYSIDLLGALKK